ncbi:MAG TPA: hypothetical protein VHA77_18285 [Xanthobacteraceae bacterium]|jgi:hypothetical protein|nr:hypothetical protein [Xanthobacteraceae bacterium]
MRKGALLLAFLLAASGPAIAATKKSKDTKAKPAPAEEVDLNANTKKLLRDGWPLILPTSLQVLYFSTHQETAAAEPAKVAKHKKKKN